MLNKKIMSYITAYEDKEALLSCVSAISSQTVPVDIVIVVDNSSKKIIESSKELKLDIIVKHCPDNIGISGGLNIAIELALKNNADFLWTFDQDSIPEPETLEKLLLSYELLASENRNIGLIGPLPIDMLTGQVWHGIDFDRYHFKESSQINSCQDYYSCDAIITSGSLINMSIAKQLSFPRKDLFIDAVDWDYCMNFRQSGYEVILVKNAILKHRFGNVKEVKSIFKKGEISIYNYSSLRYFYMCRNHTFVETRLSNFTNIVLSVFNRLRFSLILSAKILIYEKDEKYVKIWACLIGTIDGFRGKLGKNW